MAWSMEVPDLPLRDGDGRGCEAVLRVVGSAVEEGLLVPAVRRRENSSLTLVGSLAGSDGRGDRYAAGGGAEVQYEACEEAVERRHSCVVFERSAPLLI